MTCVADEFPDVPHRYCVNHFFRDLAKPVQALDLSLYTSDAADDLLCVDLGGRRIIKKKKQNKKLCNYIRDV